MDLEDGEDAGAADASADGKGPEGQAVATIPAEFIRERVGRQAERQGSKFGEEDNCMLCIVATAS